VPADPGDSAVCCVTFAESEPYCHSILFVCLSVWMSVGHSATYSLPRLIDHNQIWSAGIGLYLSSNPCQPFWIPTSHTFGARGKICKISPISKRTWRIAPYDLSVCLCVCSCVEYCWSVWVCGFTCVMIVCSTESSYSTTPSRRLCSSCVVCPSSVCLSVHSSLLCASSEDAEQPPSVSASSSV